MRASRHRALGGADHYRRTTGWQKGTCTWCMKAVPGRCQWCPSPEPTSPCVLAYLAANSPHDPRVRQAVFVRDGGCCRGCARDLAGDPPDAAWYRSRSMKVPDRLAMPARERWENDHIVPVAEGGSALGMDNLQVLCLRCHKDKTREQAHRRAKPKPPRPEVEAVADLGEQFLLFAAPGPSSPIPDPVPESPCES